MSEQAARITSALAAQGRDVPEHEIARELGGLDGLPADAAAEALQRTYRLAPDGTPLPGFERDRTPSQVVGFVYAGML